MKTKEKSMVDIFMLQLFPKLKILLDKEKRQRKL